MTTNDWKLRWYQNEMGLLFDDDMSPEYMNAIKLLDWFHPYDHQPQHTTQCGNKDVLVIENNEDCAFLALERIAMISNRLHVKILCWDPSIMVRYRALLERFVDNVNHSQKNTFTSYFLNQSVYFISETLGIFSEIHLVDSMYAIDPENSVVWIPCMRDYPVRELYECMKRFERLVLIDEDNMLQLFHKESESRDIHPFDVHMEKRMIPHDSSSCPGTLNDAYLHRMFSELGHSHMLNPIEVGQPIY